jgi:hypothetical protein
LIKGQKQKALEIFNRFAKSNKREISDRIKAKYFSDENHFEKVHNKETERVSFMLLFCRVSVKF